jgi:UDPglucose 6-dehydrogenase
MKKPRATQDNRIGSGHTKVPGHDGHKGYGGTCFPKDTNALVNFMKSIDVDSYILDATIERNETVDRPEKDWELDKGRAVSTTIKNKKKSKT